MGEQQAVQQDGDTIYVTVSDVCARWPIVSRDRLLRAIARGDLAARRERPRGKWYITIEDVDCWYRDWQHQG